MGERTVTERLCPRCQSPLLRVARGAIALDACAECGGVWFDAQELEQLRRQHRGVLAFLDKALKPRRKVDLSSAPTPLCPVCRIPLVSFAFQNVPHVTLDGCRQCRGLWTDHGELTQLQAAMRRTTAAAQPTGGSPCPNCGAENYPTDAVCLSCGAALVRPPTKRIRTPTPPAAKSQGMTTDAVQRWQERLNSVFYLDPVNYVLGAIFGRPRGQPAFREPGAMLRGALVGLIVAATIGVLAYPGWFIGLWLAFPLATICAIVSAGIAVRRSATLRCPSCGARNYPSDTECLTCDADLTVLPATPAARPAPQKTAGRLSRSPWPRWAWGGIPCLLWSAFMLAPLVVASARGADQRPGNEFDRIWLVLLPMLPVVLTVAAIPFVFWVCVLVELFRLRRRAWLVVMAVLGIAILFELLTLLMENTVASLIVLLVTGGTMYYYFRTRDLSTE